MGRVLEQTMKDASLWGSDQELSFPHITYWGLNDAGKVVHYNFNYSDDPESLKYPHGDGTELLIVASVVEADDVEYHLW